MNIDPSNPTRIDARRFLNACIANGERLLMDSANLEFLEPARTRLVLAMIAQDEFAKAFSHSLVRSVISSPLCFSISRNFRGTSGQGG